MYILYLLKGYDSFIALFLSAGLGYGSLTLPVGARYKEGEGFELTPALPLCHTYTHTHTHTCRTPAVKTAAFPPSSISSSSSSVVALPARTRSRTKASQRQKRGIAQCQFDTVQPQAWERNVLYAVHCLIRAVSCTAVECAGHTYWSLIVSECDLCFSLWSPPELHCIWSSHQQTSWKVQRAGRATWGQS